MEKVYRVHILICAGTSCVSGGSLKVKDALVEEIERNGLEDEVLVETTGCNGFCALGPIMIIHPEGIFYKYLHVEDVPFFVEEHLIKGRVVTKHLFEEPQKKTLVPIMNEIGFFKNQILVALRNRGLIDPEVIDEYIGRDGYLATAKALQDMTPEKIVDEVYKSGLRGRGGGGFLTGLKWKFCMESAGDIKYILCNADEGDPGAFMDRSILESDPHAVLEGMIIGGKAIGAHQGYIYVRAEYPLAIERLNTAISQAKDYGLLGKDILGTGFDFEVELYHGAGAFVCGEETALMLSIEGKRGMPRPRPPFPAHKGLWSKPTVLNNVETYANISQIIIRGSDWFASLGTEKSKGTKVFALSGHVNNIGLIEVPMGTTLRTIVYDIGGGISKGKELKAVQIGGPSGGCLPKSLIDTPVDYESVIKTGAIVGSGGMVVMDESSCMVDIAKFFLEFTADESCGKCTPCRVGTKVLLNKLTDIAEGRGKHGDIELLEKLSEGIKTASLCGLGQTAPNPILTTIKYFREEYEAHIYEKRCPAGVCKRLTPSPCQNACPVGLDVPSYVALIAHQRFEDALDLILEDNPFPSVCGRVCNHSCEFECTRGEVDIPIAIKDLKRYVADLMLDRVDHIKPVPITKQEKVAVIGSGPAGLTTAHDLIKMGYAVTVYEALPVTGGMMWVGIPEYRLPRNVLQAEIQAIVALGVEIKTNVKIGKDITISELKAEYDAIFVAVGAHKGRKLGIHGEDQYEGFIDSVDFLREINLGSMEKPGDKVVVIGGGNSAIDSARVAIRLGSSEVNIAYRRTRAEMPAAKEEIDAAEEEGIKIHYLVAPTRVIGSNNQVSGLECIRTELGAPDASGRRRPVPIEGSEYVIPCDVILPSISQEPEIAGLTKDLKLKTTPWNTFEVDPNTLETNIPGIFSGGDSVTGPATLIEAIAAGQRAAFAIDKYFNG
ncbi:MAG: NADH-quinone oxidoreductase subunit NuoF, partial [Candidatus Marinimicrobia bacterium]|nr:NADH-quinone oxidoreductase subunit NuoF [Candidatus Neomarinimicrobiota bacterium]